MLAEQISVKDGVGYKIPSKNLILKVARHIFKSAYFNESGKTMFVNPGVCQRFVSYEFHNDHPMGLIEGQSGSGKTHLIVSLMEQALKQGVSVTYIGLSHEIDNKDSLLSAKIVGLLSLYSTQFRVLKSEDCKEQSMKDIYLNKNELVFIDDCYSDAIKMKAEELCSLLRATNSNCIISCSRYWDVFSAKDLTVAPNTPTLSDEEYVFFKKNCSFILGWGHSELNSGTPPVGQFVLRRMHKQHIDVVYIPEL